MAEFVESRFVWSKGDWGNKGAFMAGRDEDGWFKATNMMVYDDGSIGPRAGMHRLAHTGLPTGVIRSWGYVPSVVGAYTGVIVFVVGDTAYWVPAFEAGACTTIGTLAGTETAFCSALPVLSGGVVYIATRNQGIYAWNISGSTFTRVFAQAGIYDLVLYGERLYAATDRRVYYSKAADFATWDAALNFFDVGWQFANYRMASLRNNLYFFRQGGGHFILSGAPGSTATLRETGRGLSPDAHSCVAVPPEDAAVWIPGSRNAPVYYRGGLVDTDRWAHLEDWTTSGGDLRGGAFSFGRRTLCFTGATDRAMLLRHNNIWTKHIAGVAVEVVARASDDWFVFTDAGDTAAAPTFWLWKYGTNRPGVAGSVGARPGDDSDTPLAAELHLPEWWHPQGSEVRVLKVEVDFMSFDTDTVANARFDLTVQTLRPRATATITTGGTTSGTYSFNEATGSSSASGTERHASFNVGEQGWARGFQIHLTNIASVAIRSITVTCRAEPRDAR